MLIERPIKIGDCIELGNEIGVVKKINVRTTEVENFEKCSVLYPNSQVINMMVKNWTKNDRKKRIQIVVDVAYGSDSKLVENILIECAKSNSFIMETPPPYVIFEDFGSSSLKFTLRVYLYDLENIYKAGNSLKHDIIAALKKNDITIPFTQTSVHFDQSFLDSLSKK